MARKQTKKGSKRTKAIWQGFHNVALGKQDKSSIKALPDADVVRYLQELTDADYKVSLTYTEKGSYLITVYGQWSDHMNSGYALTVFHADLYTAIKAAWYSVFELYGGERWEVDEDNW